MLTAVLIAAFGAIAAAVPSRDDFRDLLLRASVVFGIALLAITELLSAFAALRRVPLLVAWLAVIIGSLVKMERPTLIAVARVTLRRGESSGAEPHTKGIGRSCLNYALWDWMSTRRRSRSQWPRWVERFAVWERFRTNWNRFASWSGSWRRWGR